jgi:hypothetical protein
VPDYTVVERVSHALERTLTAALSTVDAQTPPIARLHNLKPPPSLTPPTLTLFLYEVTEDPTVRNRPPDRMLETVDGRQVYRVTRAPMPLILRYLLTPWAGDRRTEHRMLGRTLQVLYERQVRRGTDLDPELDVASLSITLAPLTLEERTRVWWSIQEPYRLSLNYEVRVIDLEVSAGVGDMVPPVRERQLTGVVPEP